MKMINSVFDKKDKSLLEQNKLFEQLNKENDFFVKEKILIRILEWLRKHPTSTLPARPI